ncbi:MAG TPA: enoyl-CoA hydratase-related protein [Solirubrobacteraceae bacterium]|jgi:enoyl-CoA hydratase/carnithine racemase|nr:enoyl-CoA hydratase-related protein [Solirubrobacteraceae bacterium]
MSGDYREIAYEVKDGIALITLDRPERLNAITDRLIAEMIDAVDRVDAGDEVRVAILTGRGRAFCAGADLDDGTQTFETYDGGVSEPFSMERHADGGGHLVLRLWRSTKPWIAAINGPAVGGGLTMTLPMDIRIAAEGARMGFVFTRIGLAPEACSSWFLPRLVGVSQAAEWVYSARVFDAQEALAGGLVRSVHPDDRLLQDARELAATLIERSAPVATAASRWMLWHMLGVDDPAVAHAFESETLFSLAGGPDASEGVASFLAKRPAEFPLRVSRELPAFLAERRRAELERARAQGGPSAGPSTQEADQ